MTLSWSRPARSEAGCGEVPREIAPQNRLPNHFTAMRGIAVKRRSAALDCRDIERNSSTVAICFAW